MKIVRGIDRMLHWFKTLILSVVLLISFVQMPVAQTTDSNKTLRVATIERKPFAFQQDGVWIGFSIDLWNEIAAFDNIKTEFVGSANFSEMLKAVENESVDAAAANISITHAREQKMDFSQPIFDSGLAVMMPSSAAPSVFSVIMRKELLLWLLSAVGLLVIAGGLIAFFERKNPHLLNLQHNTKFGEGLWWAVNVVTNASFTIFTPVTRSGRLVGYGLIVIGLFVVSAFVAQITSALTVGELRSQIDGVNDLYGKTVGTTEGSTSSQFLTTQSINHKTFDTLDALFEAIEGGELDAVVHDAPLLAYYVKTRGQGKFRIAGRVFNPEKYGFLFPQRSKKRERFDQGLLKLRETGEYSKIQSKWFGSDYQ
jgi:polar amino acid transport system substrate-binding protein